MKNAKRSVIITAILAIIMCASLIVGGTLALFTSNSKVNIVVSSANVDVAADVTVAEKWHKDGGATVTGSLYDTGSVEVANGSKQVDVTLKNFVPTDGVKLNVALTNNSTVKVKYRVILSANRESGTELLDALKISMNGKEFRGYTLASEFTALDAETSPAEPVSVTIEFPEDATEGMNMSCSLTIKVEAQQGNAVALNTFEVADGHTVIAEKVGNVNWYSEVDNATLLEEVRKGAKLSGNLTLTEDVDLDKTLIVADNTSVEITSDKTVSNANDLWNESTGMWSLVSARGKNSVTTINGGEWNAKENDCYAVDVQNGAKVVINDGTFIGNIHSVYVTDGIAEINGGFFAVQQKYPDANKANEFVLNCYDANRANGTAKIIVTGGTFVNFNPANCQAEGAHTNFVKEGYKVLATKQMNGDVWYTVVAKDAAGKTFSDGKDHVLNESIAVGAANGIAVKATSGKVTIEGGTYNGGEGGNNQSVHVANGATVTIKGGVFTVGHDASGAGNSVVVSNGGNVVIEGGFFYTPYSWNGFYYVLNQQNNKPGTITVKGGTFVNYDPSKGDDNLGGNFVADGYKVVSETKEKEDGTTEVWYTVVLDEENYAMITVENAEGVEEQVLAKKVNNANFVESLKDGATVILTEDVTLPDGFTFNQKNVVIDGAGKYCLKTADGNYVIYGENMTIQNVTFG